MPHFVSRVPQTAQWDFDLRQDFIRLQCRLAFARGLRRLEEFRRGDLSLLFLRPDDNERGVEGDQGRAETRWADKQRLAVVTEDGVIAVVPFADERRAALLAEQA